MIIYNKEREKNDKKIKEKYVCAIFYIFNENTLVNILKHLESLFRRGGGRDY